LLLTVLTVRSSASSFGLRERSTGRWCKKTKANVKGSHVSRKVAWMPVSPYYR